MENFRNFERDDKEDRVESNIVFIYHETQFVEKESRNRYLYDTTSEIK